MAHKTEIKFRTFDSLLASVEDDLPSQNANGYIEPSQLVKTAYKINKELNVAFEKVSEDVIEIENYRAKLPLNFYVMNFATLCGTGSKTYRDPLYKHTHTEGKCISEPICGDPCNEENVTELHITKTYKTYDVVWKTHYPVKFIDPGFIRTDCPNRHCRTTNTAYIRDGYVMTNIQNGFMYINYTPILEDEKGDLLVIDHPIINDYYETALKVKIFENMFSQGEDVVGQLRYYKEELRKTKVVAFNIVSTPGFYRMVDYLNNRRKKMYHKYIQMFK